MTPCEIIAKAIRDRHEKSSDCDVAAHAVTCLESAGYVILPAAEVEKAERALRRAEDGAGTLPAKDSVKLVPADWHALAAHVRALKGAKP